MDLFKEWARLTLVEGEERDETVYGHALPMRTALSTLKTAIRLPLITHSKSKHSRMSKKSLVDQLASTGASKNTVSTISKVSEVVGGGVIATMNPKEESFLDRVQSG